MCQVQDATGTSGAYFFFSMVVLGGSFFMLNLVRVFVRSNGGTVVGDMALQQFVVVALKTPTGRV